jgi:tetratricopeptide (TPR) repeat protein
MKILGTAGCLTLLCLTSALPVRAQQPSPAEQACNAKYTAYYNKQDDLKLFNEFVNDATCKDSMYRPNAFVQLIQNRLAASNWKDVYELSERYSKELPNEKGDGKKWVAQQAMTASAQMGDVDKILDTGEKVLVLDSQNLNAIVILSNAYPEKYPALTDAAAKEKNLNRAQELAKQTLAMMKPAAVTDSVWQQQVIGPAHSVLGFVALQRMQYPEAVGEYEQAVKISPKDPLNWFRGGLAKAFIAKEAQKPLPDLYAKANAITVAGPERDAADGTRDAAVKIYQDKRDEAMDWLATAAAMGGPVGDAAKTQLESFWKPMHDGTTAGMDDFIAKHKQA